ncbi:hypothetical protein WJX72_006294 [[Myrmecia] bisecta]|uniref:Peptidyl-prolyl cis-trans isomerase n=1 Tax=[Myrmecia] bisecta TaxID=41462 RepID=A0AAW1Q437_9CHLO
MAKDKGKGKAKGAAKDTEPAGAGEKSKSSKLPPANFVKVRHILCEKQSKILEALSKIKAGEQFATVAAQYSEDKARQGGDLGWKRRQDVVGVFADAAFALNVGEMTQTPIKSNFGYHIIMLQTGPPLPMPPVSPRWSRN